MMNNNNILKAVQIVLKNTHHPLLKVFVLDNKFEHLVCYVVFTNFQIFHLNKDDSKSELLHMVGVNEYY